MLAFLALPLLAAAAYGRLRLRRQVVQGKLQLSRAFTVARHADFACSIFAALLCVWAAGVLVIDWCESWHGRVLRLMAAFPFILEACQLVYLTLLPILKRRNQGALVPKGDLVSIQIRDLLDTPMQHYVHGYPWFLSVVMLAAVLGFNVLKIASNVHRSLYLVCVISCLRFPQANRPRNQALTNTRVSMWLYIIALYREYVADCISAKTFPVLIANDPLIWTFLGVTLVCLFALPDKGNWIFEEDSLLTRLQQLLIDEGVQYKPTDIGVKPAHKKTPTPLVELLPDDSPDAGIQGIQPMIVSDDGTFGHQIKELIIRRRKHVRRVELVDVPKK